jgi:hypothetical protein
VLSTLKHEEQNRRLLSTYLKLAYGAFILPFNYMGTLATTFIYGLDLEVEYFVGSTTISLI